MDPDKSSRSKKGATKHSGKKYKPKELSQSKGKPFEVFTSRVMRQHKKIHISDGGASPLIESMVSSSLVELSTSSKKMVPLSLSQQPLASSAPFGRVTRSRARARGITNTPSQLAGNKEIDFFDLGTEDATTPPTEMELATIPPTPTDPPAKETTATTMSAHSTSPVERGKTKLQLCIDCKVAHLEEWLHVYEVLDRHLKEENILLKERVAKLDQQLEESKSQKTFLTKCVWKWYDEFQKAQGKISMLKAKLAKAHLGNPGDLNLQASQSS